MEDFIGAVSDLKGGPHCSAAEGCFPSGLWGVCGVVHYVEPLARRPSPLKQQQGLRASTEPAASPFSGSDAAASTDGCIK